MTIYTMGFTQKSADRFFYLIEKNRIQMLIDIRLNNKSQLAGFTKGSDLSYFLAKICQCKYSHEILFAPTKEILDDYKKGVISWGEYDQQYRQLIEKRAVDVFFENRYLDYDRVLLLCSEPTPENCHRRLLAEYLQKKTSCEIIHL